jgi:hypothetical protein
LFHLALIASVLVLVLGLLGLSAFNLGASAPVFLVVAIIAGILWFFVGAMGRRAV